MGHHNLFVTGQPVALSESLIPLMSLQRFIDHTLLEPSVPCLPGFSLWSVSFSLLLLMVVLSIPIAVTLNLCPDASQIKIPNSDVFLELLTSLSCHLLRPPNPIYSESNTLIHSFPALFFISPTFDNNDPPDSKPWSLSPLPWPQALVTYYILLSSMPTASPT